MKYEIKNQPFTVLTLHMDQGESIKCQSGAMAWMTPGIQMETKTGGLGGMELTLAKHSPGDIMAFNISETPIIAQKTSFLAATEGVNMDIYLQKRAATGFFGGEGFLMQAYSGSGYAWLEIDGSVQERELGAGEQLVVDSGYVAAMEATCSMEIVTVKGFTNVVLGGEGLFNTLLTGPGKVWIQTMPVSAVASVLRPYMPTGN